MSTRPLLCLKLTSVTCESRFAEETRFLLSKVGFSKALGCFVNGRCVGIHSVLNSQLKLLGFVVSVFVDTFLNPTESC